MMTMDEAILIVTILSVILVLAGYAIARNYKPPTMLQDIPRETTVEQKKKAWDHARDELGGKLRRVK